FAGVGGAVFAAFAGTLPDRARRVSRAFLVVGSGALVAALGLQGLDALDRPLADIASPAVWRAGFATSYGWTIIFAGLALIDGWLALPAGGAPRRIAAAAALACVGLALAASGHASAAQPQWLMRSAVFLHAVALCFWLGALIPLFVALLPSSRTTDAVQALQGFSRLIPVPLVLVLVTGIVLASMQLGAPG